MIRPVRFASNPLTAASNRFQGRTRASPDEQQARAQREFDILADALRDNGINVIVVDDTVEPHTPDSIFPNNWISFHADGRVVLYPMEAENRRTERRMDIVDALDADLGFSVSEIVDLAHHEQNEHYLEGTGSMVLDRANHIAYACLIAFDAVDRDGVPIYHTNVLMNVGEKLAVICDAAIARDEQRSAVLQRLQDTGHEIVSLSYEQLDAFAGNMLELRNRDGARVVAMSQQAFDSLSEKQRSILEANGIVLAAPIDTIEASAGGSVRCMLAEVHLPESA
jgi:hypothetical protein